MKIAYDELLRCGFLDLVMWVNEPVEGKVKSEMMHDELLKCGA